MKHKNRNRIVLVLLICVACVLALGTTFARAEEGAGSASSNELSLTVNIERPNTDGSASDDVESISPQVDVYLVASGTKAEGYETYDYTLEGAFSSLADTFKKATTLQNVTAAQAAWHDLAEGAKLLVEAPDANIQKVKSENDEPFIVGSPIILSKSGPGIYLVNIQPTNSTKYTYTFSPVLVAVPGKVDDGMPAYNTSEGSWTGAVNAMVINEKWSRSQLTGILTINKIVRGFSGEGATFVYHIWDEDTDGKTYENYASVQFKAGEQQFVKIEVPTGIRLRIKEVYTGARYQLKDPNQGEFSFILNKENEYKAEVFFENEPNNSGKGGHGIENRFVYSKEKGWVRTEVYAIDPSEDITPKANAQK